MTDYQSILGFPVTENEKVIYVQDWKANEAQGTKVYLCPQGFQVGGNPVQINGLDQFFDGSPVLRILIDKEHFPILQMENGDKLTWLDLPTNEKKD